MMDRFSKVVLSDRLFQVYTRLDGMRVKGFVTTSPVGTSNAQVPFRVLSVRNPCLVAPGDTLHGRNGEKMILLRHPSDFDWATSFKVAYAMQAYPWKRPTAVLHPVTGLPTSGSAKQDLGLVYVNLDTPVEVQTLGLNENEYRFITGNPVLKGDYIGDKIVQNVQEVLGARLVYAK